MKDLDFDKILSTVEDVTKISKKDILCPIRNSDFEIARKIFINQCTTRGKSVRQIAHYMQRQPNSITQWLKKQFKSDDDRQKYIKFSSLINRIFE